MSEEVKKAEVEAEKEKAKKIPASQRKPGQHYGSTSFQKTMEFNKEGNKENK